MSSRYLTVAAVADELGLTAHGVLALIHSGTLIASNISTGSKRPRWRIAADELSRWLTSRESVRPIVTRRRHRPSKVTEYV